MIAKTETIAAIATAMTNSGIGIIRISGNEAITVADRIYRTKSGKRKLSEFKSHTIHYGFIIDGGETVDEVMVSVMKAPGSYTMEDTVEINCHGGILLMNRILGLIIRNGARLAEPGEFTKRAFLNGRIDLSEAEAVIDIIYSRNDFALKSSVGQLRGFLSEEIKDIRKKIVYEIAFIESALDDPEHISLDGYYDRLSDTLEIISNRLKKLLLSAENGKILKEGIHTVIVGKPNAGKSSLMNLLTGEEKAIVTDVAGTTRDIIEEQIILDGISLNVIDTAGIRSTSDEVEKIGVKKAKKYAVGADLIIYMVDSSVALDESDEDIFQMIKDKKTIVLFNKIDLNPMVTLDELAGKVPEGTRIIRTSTKENMGLEEFGETVKEMFFHGGLSFNDEVFITNMRHKQAVSDAYDSLKMVKKSIEDRMPEDFLSIDLMSAYTSLGYVIGEEVGEDLVNEIFSKFCMGK